MKAIIAAGMLMLTSVGAQTLPETLPETLTGPQITEALTGRVLGFDNGVSQEFKVDGRTLYQTDKAEWGRWRVEGDRYCSQWPPSDRWSCYAITREALTIGFWSGDGSVTRGSYIDLQ